MNHNKQQGGGDLRIEVHEGFPDTEIHINCPQVSDEIRKIEVMLKSCDKKLAGTKNDQTHMIDKRDVLYFESVDKQCFFYTINETYETPLKLYEIEAQLSGIGFFRCSKSQIVNISMIASLCPEFGGRIEIVMENGEKLIASRQYARALKERLGLK